VFKNVIKCSKISTQSKYSLKKCEYHIVEFEILALAGVFLATTLRIACSVQWLVMGKCLLQGTDSCPPQSHTAYNSPSCVDTNQNQTSVLWIVFLEYKANKDVPHTLSKEMEVIIEKHFDSFEAIQKTKARWL